MPVLRSRWWWSVSVSSSFPSPSSPSSPSLPSLFRSGPSVSGPSGPYLPGAEAPAPCEVPQFAPVRVRGGRYQLLRLVRHRRRAVAAGLAVTAAALVAAGPRTAPDAPDAPDVAGPPRGGPARGHPAPAAERAGEPPVESGSGTVTAPVRIADAATVRLLRPGDRVDVIAAEDPAAGGQARVMARGVTVSRVPEPERDADGNDGGALVVLSVPRATAARLAGASATARLAVTLW
ncbi:RcpC/CpaB family pilus assembly protein [Streptomyces anandii]|uniref:RcpC/CpaB family pilus assembly protein n=1 Tax=Streptomyces anandii TaxID=285454 RepID=UPI0036FA4451